MRLGRRASIGATVATAAVVALTLAGCATGAADSAATFSWGPGSGSATASSLSAPPSSGSASSSSTGTAPVDAPVADTERFTVNFAGDVHFMGRTAARLAADPSTVFGQAQPALADADLTMVNLETSITTRGTPQAKEYHFRTDPAALTALRDAGIDVATEANNHAADYGEVGLSDTLSAIKASGFPVIGIGADASDAFAPYRTTINGAKIAIFAADDVDDETTLRLFSAGPSTPGVANAHDPRLITDVRAAARAGYVVIVYVHWGTEDVNCADAGQETLASQLAAAGAAAIIGAHPHVQQGAGWLPNGTYVDYSVGDYLWWTADSAAEYDTGLLTLTFDHGKVAAQHFAPAEIDNRGVPVPATGATAARINKTRDDARACAGHLSATPPASHH